MCIMIITEQVMSNFTVQEILFIITVIINTV